MLCFIASVDRQTFGAAALDRDVYVVPKILFLRKSRGVEKIQNIPTRSATLALLFTMVFVIRVKTNAGNFRVGGLDPYNATSADVVAAFPTTASDAFRSCRVDGMHITTPLCTDPRCTVPLDANRPLAYQGLNHGGSVHCKVAFRHPQPPPGLGCNTRKYDAAVTASSKRIAPPSARAVGGGSTAVATSGVGDASRRPKSLLDLEARPKIGLHQQTIRPRNAL